MRRRLLRREAPLRATGKAGAGVGIVVIVIASVATVGHIDAIPNEGILEQAVLLGELFAILRDGAVDFL